MTRAGEDVTAQHRCRGCDVIVHEVEHPVLGRAWADADDIVSCPSALTAHEPVGPDT